MFVWLFGLRPSQPSLCSRVVWPVSCTRLPLSLVGGDHYDLTALAGVFFSFSSTSESLWHNKLIWTHLWRGTHGCLGGFGIWYREQRSYSLWRSTLLCPGLCVFCPFLYEFVQNSCGILTRCHPSTIRDSSISGSDEASQCACGVFQFLLVFNWTPCESFTSFLRESEVRENLGRLSDCRTPVDALC